MRQLTRKEFLDASGINEGEFKTIVARGDAVMAYGTSQPLAGGAFLDLDVPAWRLADELKPAFGRKLTGVLLRTFSDQWTEAIAVAERSKKKPIFLIVLENGEKLPASSKMRGHYAGINVSYATLTEIAEKLPSAKTIPNRLTLINITNLLAVTRKEAAAAGVNLSAPFLPPPDDPAFQKACNETRKARERHLPRLGA